MIPRPNENPEIEKEFELLCRAIDAKSSDNMRKVREVRELIEVLTDCNRRVIIKKIKHVLYS